MPHQNIVFHDLLKRIPWARFEAAVAAHGADRRVRRLSTRTQLIALLFGQLAGAASLRELVAGLQSHGARLYHLGARPVSRATLADANATRPSAVFAELFGALVQQAGRGLRRHVGEAVHLIDATGVRLAGAGAEWARFSANAGGAKVHVIFDAGAEQPIYAAVTTAKVNDITAAKAMPIEAGATYVFDLGYYDYGWWARMHAAGCRLVTRFKANTLIEVTTERPVPATEGDILSDRIGRLPPRQARSRRNPFAAPVRELRVRLETGTILRILSNDLTCEARTLADLYKRRWAIELFFRWIKQTLKIRHFLGRGENAVRLQIAVALIAYLLLRMARDDHREPIALLTFARLVRTNLMHRRPVDALSRPRTSMPRNPDQLVLQWA